MSHSCKALTLGLYHTPQCSSEARLLTEPGASGLQQQVPANLLPLLLSMLGSKACTQSCPLTHLPSSYFVLDVFCIVKSPPSRGPTQ